LVVNLDAKYCTNVPLRHHSDPVLQWLWCVFTVSYSTGRGSSAPPAVSNMPQGVQRNPSKCAPLMSLFALFPLSKPTFIHALMISVDGRWCGCASALEKRWSPLESWESESAFFSSLEAHHLWPLDDCGCLGCIQLVSMCMRCP
jgi:hypothetical protein